MLDVPAGKVEAVTAQFGSGWAATTQVIRTTVDVDTELAASTWR